MDFDDSQFQDEFQSRLESFKEKSFGKLKEDAQKATEESLRKWKASQAKTRKNRVRRERAGVPSETATIRERERVRRHHQRARDEQEEVRAFAEMAAGRKKLLKALLREKAYRKMRAVNLYQPLPKQLAFHKSIAPERLAIGGNRAGKTTVCAMEVAWACTGTHPYWSKYPAENGRIMCVAKNIIKIGEVIFPKLFKRGAFELVHDKETGLLRVWDPPRDGFEIKRVPSLPMIDERMIKAIAWERKAISVPKKVTLKNGWELTFWSADGKPPNGMEADMVWFDEEVEAKEWYEEVSARLPSRNGRFIWSATPQAASQLLWDLHEKGIKEIGKKRPRVEEFHFIFDDSPFIEDEARQDFKDKAAMDPDNYRVRILGEYLIKSHRVYPNFSVDTHCVPFMEIPFNWCRYLVIDPGYANAVALFVAVPPSDSEWAGHVYVYDELYTKQADVMEFVKRLEAKCRSQWFQAFVIDSHGSRRTESNGKTIGQQYSEQFELRGLRSVDTGSDFIAVGGEQTRFGTKTLKGEIQQVRAWLWPSPDLGGDPVLRVFEECCPQFIEEMKSYSNKIIDGKASDEPDSRKYSHGPDALRYAVLHGVPWVEPTKPKYRGSVAWQKWREARRKAKDGNYILLGSTGKETKNARRG